jgi:two-component system sensor histidine kinase UhpB
LAFAKMMLDTSKNSPEISEMCIDKSYDGINMAIEEVRKLSHTLVPPKFSVENSFMEAVVNIAEEVKLTGKFDIQIDIPANGRFMGTDEKVKLAFYRIIQEQLNNIVKYSKCSKVGISIGAVNGFYQLAIEDNGIGFDKEKKQDGIGLLNMASRVELLGGHMDIETAPGKGCSLFISIPVSKTEK